MTSYKAADYDYVNIFGKEGVYTEDLFTDELPEGYHIYSVKFRDEQRILTENSHDNSVAFVITKEPISFSGKSMDVDETDLLFEDKEFVFEEYFEGIHRPIDYKINEAENKRNEQFQSKERAHTKSFSQELM